MTLRNAPNVVRRPKAARATNADTVAAGETPQERARRARDVIVSLPATHNEVRRLLPLWIDAVTELVAGEAPQGKAGPAKAKVAE